MVELVAVEAQSLTTDHLKEVVRVEGKRTEILVWKQFFLYSFPPPRPLPVTFSKPEVNLWSLQRFLIVLYVVDFNSQSLHICFTSLAPLVILMEETNSSCQFAILTSHC